MNHMSLVFGTQTCGSLAEGAQREWLVPDGRGGYAMGTVCGLRTRRYHALLVVSGETPAARHVGLVSLDPVLTLPSGATVRLGVHEWSSGAVEPRGHRLLERFDLVDDLWCSGRFAARMSRGQCLEVSAWAGDLGTRPAPATAIVERSRRRVRALVAAAPDPVLAVAADAFVIGGPSGPEVVAGYPWFGAWSRDTMISYEGLFLSTGRVDEGRALLRAYAATLSEGMLANTADTGRTEYNTVDATLWYSVRPVSAVLAS